MHTAQLTITGMTCGHCERSVREELSELPGVTSVTADHAAGTATVVSEAPLDAAALREAVEEAGYALVDIR